MKKVIFIYLQEPECTGCVIGVWCDTKEQVVAMMEAGEERIHAMKDSFDESMTKYGYSVVKIGEV